MLNNAQGYVTPRLTMDTVVKIVTRRPNYPDREYVAKVGRVLTLARIDHREIPTVELKLQAAQNKMSREYRAEIISLRVE